MYLLAEVGSPLNLESNTQLNAQEMCGRKDKAPHSSIKGRKHAASRVHVTRTELLGDPWLQKLERQRKHPNPITGVYSTEDCKSQPKKKKQPTVNTLYVWRSRQEPLRNVHKVGLILTRDAGQIRVRVTGPAGSKKAGQPPCGFVPASPAALHGVAANCSSASHRRLRPGSSVLPLLPQNSGETRVPTASFTRWPSGSRYPLILVLPFCDIIRPGKRKRLTAVFRWWESEPSQNQSGAFWGRWGCLWKREGRRLARAWLGRPAEQQLQREAAAKREWCREAPRRRRSPSLSGLVNEALRPGRPGDSALRVPSMSAGPGCEPCTKRPRWGAAATSPPAASDARSFPSRQRRVLDSKDAPVQFRVPPSSSGCVPGRAGPHRGSSTSLGTWGNKDLCPSLWPEPFGLCLGTQGLQSPLSGVLCAPLWGPFAEPMRSLVGECGRIFSFGIGGVRNPGEQSLSGGKRAVDSTCLLFSGLRNCLSC